MCDRWLSLAGLGQLPGFLVPMFFCLSQPSTPCGPIASNLPTAQCQVCRLQVEGPCSLVFRPSWFTKSCSYVGSWPRQRCKVARLSYNGLLGMLWMQQDMGCVRWVLSAPASPSAGPKLNMPKVLILNKFRGVFIVEEVEFSPTCAPVCGWGGTTGKTKAHSPVSTGTYVLYFQQLSGL